MNILADLYLFPQPARAIAQGLQKQFPGFGEEQALDCFSYLEKKGYVRTEKRKDGQRTAAVTAEGIDLVEGAVADRGVLAAAPEFSGLAIKKEIRGGALSYCRMFPDCYNGDDEILAELRDMGFRTLAMDQVRHQLWYLSLKKFVELKTRPLGRDVVFMARITGRGIDVVEGAISDPGVACDG